MQEFKKDTVDARNTKKTSFKDTGPSHAGHRKSSSRGRSPTVKRTGKDKVKISELDPGVTDGEGAVELEGGAASATPHKQH